jgi:hypothetical protein
MARSRRNPGNASWQMLSGVFRPQTTTEVKKVTNSERTRISYFTALTSPTYVVLPKENHMQLTEAATLDRKSGKAEGSAVLRTFPGNVLTERSGVESLPRRAVGSALSFQFSRQVFSICATSMRAAPPPEKSPPLLSHMLL